MNAISACLLLALVGGPTAAFAQAPDVNRILADARRALGGEKKLSAVKTLSATGQSVRVTNNASSAPADVEMAFDLPDKFMKKDVVQMMGGFAITRISGFNGDQPINIIDQPPSTGGMIQIRLGPAGGEGSPATPEQQEQQRRNAVLSGKQELARIGLGMLLPLAAYPLQFAYAAQAESPDGKADVLNVTGEGGFAARLFIDSASHLPLMLTWMAKEPLRITMNRTAGSTPDDRDKILKRAEEQRKAAEASLRVVEHRIYYGDYRDVEGVKVPFKFQRSIDGKPTEEVTLEKVRVNGTIDARKFNVK